MPDGGLCLLDWASAGIFPRLFEDCAQELTASNDAEFTKAMFNLLNLNDLEMKNAKAVLNAHYHAVRYRK